MEIILTVATVLGGIAAIWYFVDKWRATRIRVNPSPSVTGRTTPGMSSVMAHVQDGSLPSVPTKQDGARAQHTETSLPLEAALEALHDPKTTALQKSQFTQREKGRFVTWTGKTQSVSKMSERAPNSDIIVVLSSATSDPCSPSGMATAVFPHSEASVLAQLHAGDIVVIEGTLSFRTLGYDWSVSLKSSRFVRVITA